MYALAYSPDDRLLGCGTESKTATIVTLEGQQVAKLSGDSGAVTHVSFDAAASRVLAGRALWTIDGKAIVRKAFSMLATFVNDDVIASAGPDFERDYLDPALWLFTPSGEEIRRVALPARAETITAREGLIGVSAGPHVWVLDAKGEKLGGFLRHASGHKVSGLALGAGVVSSGGYGDQSIWVTDYDGGNATELPGYARPTQGNGLRHALHAPNLLLSIGGEAAAAGGGDAAVVHDLERKTKVHLLASAKSWLALQDDGRFVGNAALSPLAAREDAGVLERLFAS